MLFFCSFFSLVEALHDSLFKLTYISVTKCVTCLLAFPEFQEMSGERIESYTGIPKDSIPFPFYKGQHFPVCVCVRLLCDCVRDLAAETFSAGHEGKHPTPRNSLLTQKCK